MVADTGKTNDPWRGYRLCLSELPDSGHVAVIQDDTIVCRNFPEALEEIAAANEDTIVSLFLSKGGKTKRTYHAATLRHGRSRYADCHPQDLVHVVGVLWPVERARAFLRWVDANPKRFKNHKPSISDDENLSRWRQLTCEQIRVTIPSIVEHPDDVPSIASGDPHRARNGKDSSRVAAYWIGDEDPLALDWSR